MVTYRELLAESLMQLSKQVRTCEMSDDDMKSAFEFAESLRERNTYMSKYEACRFLHMSRATFDRLVADGKIPRGQKHLGLKELTWKKSDLDSVQL